jgi:SAM-dependent methyltransferase
VVRDRLPDLAGRHVLHVGAGAGGGTAELTAGGALVTAVEPDARLVAAGREREPSAVWLESPLDALPLELGRGRFHLVLADHTLARVGDLHAWAHGLEAALRPGGYLLLHDDHPLLRVVDQLLRWRGGYEEGPTVGSVVTALARAGLVVRRVEELSAPRPRGRVPGELLVVARKP